MGTSLLLYLAVTSSCWQYPAIHNEKECIKSNPVKNLWSFLSHYNPKNTYLTDNELRILLARDNLNPEVIDKVATTIECAERHNLDYKPILTVIDYSISANKKRFWVYDLMNKKLLYHTYVSHGITSGALLTEFFSNTYNSKASSIGVYKTNNSYWGRDGLSMRLTGVDNGFNDNAHGRAIVMHGGWYVDESFINNYGRPGRSWGCPALPTNMVKKVINTIKDDTLMVMYYPTENWFTKSKYLNCKNFVHKPSKINLNVKPFVKLDNKREEVLFVRNSKNSNSETILAIPASVYARVFVKQPPVERMLRRQIEKREYIAISKNEYLALAKHPENLLQEILNEIQFVTPEIVMERGYYKTKMKITNLGKILALRTNANAKKYLQQASNTQNTIEITNDKIITPNTNKTDALATESISKPENSEPTSELLIIDSDKGAIKLTPSDRFIRWIGL